MTSYFQNNLPSPDLDRLVSGQLSHNTISVQDNAGGHKNKESSNDGEPTAAEKYSTETAEKYLSATEPGVPVSPGGGPGVKHNDTSNTQPGALTHSLEVRTKVLIVKP